MRQTPHPRQTPGPHWTRAAPAGDQRALWTAGGVHRPVRGARGTLRERGADLRGPVPSAHLSADARAPVGIRWAVAKDPRTVQHQSPLGPRGQAGDQTGHGLPGDQEETVQFRRVVHRGVLRGTNQRMAL